MKWSSHRVVTGLSLFAITNNPVFAMIAAEGSVFPDRIEYIFNDWQKHHRKSSHWFPIYLSIILFLYFFMNQNNLFIKTVSEFLNVFLLPLNIVLIKVFSNLFFWYFIGAVFHIIEDAFCGEIPILYPSQKCKFIRLFYVGTIKEFLFVTIFCTGIVAYKFYPFLENNLFK